MCRSSRRPCGLLREPIASLRRAGLIVVTRADRASPEQKRRLLERIRSVRGDEGCVEVAFPPERLVNARGKTVSLEKRSDIKAAAFCAIGNPEAFRQTLSEARYDIPNDQFFTFPDHHHYTAQDLEHVASTARLRLTPRIP